MNEPQLCKTVVAFDNGCTGSIAIIYPGGDACWYPTPTKKCKNYQKTAHTITRVNVNAMVSLLKEKIGDIPTDNLDVILERPYCNPQGFNASLSAARALEATLIALEAAGIVSYQFTASSAWQEVMLPKGTTGTKELKKASYEVGKKLFPSVNFKKDADSLLMAEWARRKYIAMPVVKSAAKPKKVLDL